MAKKINIFSSTQRDTAKDLQKELDRCREELSRLEFFMKQHIPAYAVGTVVRINGQIKPEYYQIGDTIKVVDSTNKFFNCFGIITQPPQSGMLKARLFGTDEETEWSIGTVKQKQVNLVSNFNGESCLVALCGSPIVSYIECWCQDYQLRVGQMVSINTENQIVHVQPNIAVGEVGKVLSLNDDKAIVKLRSGVFCAINPWRTLTKNSLVTLDPSKTVVTSVWVFAKEKEKKGK